MNRISNWAPRMLSLLRIIVALLYVEHGTEKLLHFPVSNHPMPPGGLPPIIVVAGLMELIGGGLLALGLLTRPVAFLLCGEMAVAYFMVHAPQGFFPATNMGEPAVLYCFVFLYLVFAGPGPISLDALIGRGKAAVQP